VLCALEIEMELRKPPLTALMLLGGFLRSNIKITVFM
jgi:hypothetical protein